MSAIKNTLINQLALQYSKTRDQFVFTDLMQALEPFIKRKAKKWGRMYQRGEFEDFQQEFSIAVYQAAKNYDGRSDFIRRLRMFMDCRGTDWMRKLKTEQREFELSAESLDATIRENDNGEPETLLDQIASEENVEEQVMLKQLAADFGAINRQAGQIIQLYIEGVSNTEIAQKLGAKSYDSRIRKQVQRAKDSFKRFLHSA